MITRKYFGLEKGTRLKTVAFNHIIIGTTNLIIYSHLYNVTKKEFKISDLVFSYQTRFLLLVDSEVNKIEM